MWGSPPVYVLSGDISPALEEDTGDVNVSTLGDVGVSIHGGLMQGSLLEPVPCIYIGPALEGPPEVEQGLPRPLGIFGR